MSTNIALRDSAQEIENVLVNGNLASLKPEERISYYKMVCDSVGLNPLTKPFDYITLNGRLTLYTTKSATDQLRSIHTVSVSIVAREVVDDCYVVTSRATMPNGRTDESIGAVAIANLKGDAKCNAIMKAETKAKRRVTLSICGLGMLDESELETIPARSVKPVERTTEDIPLSGPGMGPATETKGPSKATMPPVEDLAAAAEASLALKPASLPEGHIEQGQAMNFAKMFKDSLKKNLKNQATNLEHAWLKKQGIVDGDGEGTAYAILKENFYEVRESAIQYASSLV